LIIVNDGSTDATGTVVEEWMRGAGLHDGNSGDALFRATLIAKENEGAGMARNDGTRAAHGKYILYLDSDDILLPFAGERLVAQFESENADMVVFGYEVFVGARSNIIDRVEGLTGDMIHLVAAGRLVLAAGRCACRRAFLSTQPGWLGRWPRRQDTELLQRLLFQTRSVSGMPDVLVQIRRGRDDAMSGKKDMGTMFECDAAFLENLRDSDWASRDALSCFCFRLADKAVRFNLSRDKALSNC
jgi:glycosyltransferase involved in cell wall biosynthesis